MGYNRNITYIGKRPSIVYLNGFFDNNERIIMGDKMDHRMRRVWPGHGPWVTGTVGFLDFEVIDDGLGPYMRLQLMGIEPGFRDYDNAQALLTEAERIAEKRGIAAVETSGVKCDNDPMLNIFEKLGYSETHDGVLHNLPWREQKKSDPNWLFDVRFVKYLAGVDSSLRNREYQAVSC